MKLIESKTIKIEHYNSGDNLEQVITECLNDENWSYFYNPNKLRVYFINRDLDTIRTTRLGSIKAVSPILIERLYQMNRNRSNNG